MALRNATFLALAAGLAFGSACGDDDPPPAFASGTSSGKGGSSSSSSGSTGDGGGGDGSSAGGSDGGPLGGEGGGGTSATIPNGGTQSVSSGGFGNNPGTDPPNGSTLCSAEMTLGTPTKLEISTDDDDLFGAITPDELTIAWTTVASDVVTLHYASRASSDVDFETPSALVIPAAPDAVALGADGLQVAFVNADRRGFSVATRATTGDAFADFSAGDFTSLDAPVLMLPEDVSYGDPVIGSMSYFFYSIFGGSQTETLYFASRYSDLDAWSPGSAIPMNGDLADLATDRWRPTGASLDAYTIFLRDDGSDMQVAGFLDETGTVETWVELGDLRGGAPNADCSRLYYSAPDASLDLYFAPLE